MNLMSVSIKIYLIFVRLIVQIVLILTNLNEMISKIKIKSNRSGCKIANLYCKYTRLFIDFPEGRFDYERLTAIIFFGSIHRLINVKILLHH